MATGKILLIEDEADIARLFEYALKNQGHLVRTVQDGVAGLKAFRRWRPDIILLDVVLPGMSGHEFLEALRKESRVYVILVSGKRSASDRALGVKLGADEHLSKPFSLDELRERVKLALSRPARDSRGPAASSAAKSSPASLRARRSAPR